MEQRADRKTIEKNRRNQMKDLYAKLNSLVPHQRSREGTSLPDQLEDAVNYIKKLQINLEKLREKKDGLAGFFDKTTYCNAGFGRDGVTTMGGLKSPQIEIHEKGSSLTIVMITGLDFQFMFDVSIRVLHEEGFDIVNASFSVVEETVFHTIYSEINGDYSARGSAAARISERLNKFVNDQAGAF